MTQDILTGASLRLPDTYPTAPFATGLAAIQRALKPADASAVVFNCRNADLMFQDEDATVRVTAVGQEVRSMRNALPAPVFAKSRGTAHCIWKGDRLYMPREAWFDVALPFIGGARTMIGSIKLLGGDSRKALFEAYLDGDPNLRQYAAASLALTSGGVWESFYATSTSVKAEGATVMNVGDQQVVASTFDFTSPTTPADAVISIDGVTDFSGQPAGTYNTEAMDGIRIGAHRAPQSDQRRIECDIYDLAFVTAASDVATVVAEWVARRPAP